MKLENTKGTLSLLLILEGLLLLFCTPIALNNNEQFWPLIVPSLIALIVGGSLMYISSKSSHNVISNKKSIFLIVLIWCITVIIGALPFFLSKSINSFTDILFETISGLTSTGTSLLPIPKILPKSILFWRSLTQWYGGILTISLLLLVFPEINIGGYKIFSIKENKSYLVARVFIIYCILTFMQVILLSSGGMSVFNSFCISFATMSTGCFLPDNIAIASYTPYNQMIIAVFMFLSGISVLFYYKLFTLKKSIFRKNEEIRLYFSSFLVMSILFSWILYSQSNHDRVEIIRGSIFQTASFLSSSGFEISEYRLWPHYFLPVLYLLIVIGGCTNSSSGGIKMSRFLVLFRNIKTPFKNPLNDSDGSEISLNGKKIDDETNLNVLTFITIFGFVLVLGTLVLTFATNDLEKSVFLTVTALSTFGHNMNLADLPQAGKILISILMLIGRLEIFPFLALLVPSFYKKSTLDSEKLID